MNTIQTEILLERFYIYNGDGSVKYFNTKEELKQGLHFVTNHGYNTIGVDYCVPDSLPGSKDLLVKTEDETSFSISKDVNKENNPFEKEMLCLAM